MNGVLRIVAGPHLSFLKLADSCCRSMDMKRIYLTMTAALAAAGIAIAGGLSYYQKKMSTYVHEAESAQEYDRHYLFVSSDRSEMMNDIFSAASAAAEESGAYLEWCGSGTEESYTDTESMDISIALGADGIILCPDGSSDLSDSVDRAAHAGIPVVTILRDLADSRRISYAGVSGYQTGELYGGRLISLLHDGENDVCLLEDRDVGKDAAQLLYTQMIQAVSNGAPSGKVMHLRTEEVDSSTDFAAEEVIRNLLLSGDTPDILICVDPVQTECAIQALIDYNLVGRVQVIGYYATEAILTALKQKVISVSMTIDTKQMGEAAVDALNEYLSLGRVSSYYNITLNSITPMTVNKYLEEKEGGSAGEEDGV